MSFLQKKDIVKAHFKNLSRTVCEFFILPKVDRDRYREYVEHKGLDYFMKAKARGKGVIIVACMVEAQPFFIRYFPKSKVLEASSFVSHGCPNMIVICGSNPALEAFLQDTFICSTVNPLSSLFKVD